MSKALSYKSLEKVVTKLRGDLNPEDPKSKKFVLLYAYNGTGKTRLSMTFKDRGREHDNRDTLYFNAYTEDLFYWDNDLENDTTRVLKINSNSKFFNGFKEHALEEKIYKYFNRYSDLQFKIDYKLWYITFSKGEATDIKISRGEENIFIWCIFLTICELVIDGDELYAWVKYIYIDDPISSLDDNNAISVASDLSNLLKNENNKVKTVISSHHALFFNVMCNELRKQNSKQYFLYHDKDLEKYKLSTTGDTPFFYHLAMLAELKKATDAGRLYTYHFNILRNIFDKTSSFFGYKNFSACIEDMDDEELYARALNVLSHGNYSIYEPKEMGMDSKDLFRNILYAFLNKYDFNLTGFIHEEDKETIKNGNDR
ncbi:MAG: anticodon nuclease [Treponema sp. CETP13]|nr:MAG: anticodon nuclease [Treponema sp. CETP13]